MGRPNMPKTVADAVELGAPQTPGALADHQQNANDPSEKVPSDPTSESISADDSVSEPSSDDLDDDLGPGMMTEVSELYRENSDCDWDEWAPDNVGRDRTPEWDKYAIIVYSQKKARKSALVLHSIKIQSPLLRTVLDTVFEGYEGITTKLKELKHYEPFHEFYYRWHLFEKAFVEEQDETTRLHLRLLYPVISKEIRPHIEAMEDYTKNNVITFEYLWAIFPPGMIVYSKVDDRNRLFEVTKSRYLKDFQGNPYLSIECRYIDCDGAKFGYVKDSLSVGVFSGVKKITELAVIPSHLCPDGEALLDRLHHRGEKFERHLGCKHVNYSGFYTAPDSRSRKRRHVRLSSSGLSSDHIR